MSVIERATANFRDKLSGELLFVEVPEWGEPDNPLKIYFKPALNFKAQGKILSLFKQDKDEEAVCQSLIIKALDKDGKHLFKQTDMPNLLHDVDPEIVNRILNEMNSQLDDAESLKKT
jgi:hypothetical protein